MGKTSEEWTKFCDALRGGKMSTESLIIADLAAEEKRSELHAKINQAVSDALSQDIGQSWHDLGKKVGDRIAACEKEREEEHRSAKIMEQSCMTAIRRADAAEARCKRLEVALHAVLSAYASWQYSHPFMGLSEETSKLVKEALSE